MKWVGVLVVEVVVRVVVVVVVDILSSFVSKCFFFCVLLSRWIISSALSVFAGRCKGGDWKFGIGSLYDTDFASSEIVAAVSILSLEIVKEVMGSSSKATPTISTPSARFG